MLPSPGSTTAAKAHRFRSDHPKFSLPDLIGSGRAYSLQEKRHESPVRQTELFQNKELERFSNNHGQVTRENRDWEDTYRNRWRHDKIVRSTHGVNCTGSCSWKIYVKAGIVTWETQQTDYPRTRAGLPNHEPRGCARGASYSWYLYSANRVKNPLIRGKL